jgi:hypothetical protein
MRVLNPFARDSAAIMSAFSEAVAFDPAGYTASTKPSAAR